MPLRRGELSERDLETAVFTIFIYARMLLRSRDRTVSGYGVPIRKRSRLNPN